MRPLITILALAVSCFASEVPGVGNFHQVNDHVYRGAQPSPQGFESLAKLGVKTVIDLRGGTGRSNGEKKVVEAAGMRYINIPLDGLKAPSDAEVAKLLTMFDDSKTGPVFIHCRRGADRTGTICACYRISHDHWENDKALSEAKQFGMSWTERAMQWYVMHFGAAAASLPAAATVQN